MRTQATSGGVGDADCRRTRGQGGYVLGVTLGAMVIGLTIITALLGLSFATQASAIEQQRMARERRAADGALEVGVDALRASLAGGGSPEADCTDPAQFPSTVPMRLARSAAAADEDVEVRCDPALDPATSRAQVTVVGDGYGGSLFSSADDPPFDLSNTVLHQGAGPVRFVGDVEVKRGAVLDGTTLGARVSGSYRQGAIGAGATEGCGPLSPSVGPPSRALIEAVDGEPVCGSARAAALQRPDPPAVSRPAPGAVPTCAGGQAVVQAGYFGPAATAGINALLAGCAKVVFEPGPDSPGADPAVFWFDGGVDSTLQFSQSGASYVFGSELSGSSPAMCDPDAGGKLSVVLGGGTDLSHTAGALSICAGADNPVALTSTAEADTQPSLTFVDSFGPWTDPQKSLNGWGDPSGTARVDLCAVNERCFRWPRLTYRVVAPGVGEVESLAVRLRAEEFPPAIPAERQLWVTLSKAGTVCQLPFPTRGRVAQGQGLSFNLGTCLNGTAFVDAFPDGDALDGATLVLELRTWPEVGGADAACQGECPWRAAVGGVELLANTSVVPAASASSGDGSWDSPNRIAAGAPGATTFVGCVWAGPGLCFWDAEPPVTELDVVFGDASGSDAELASLVLELDVASADDVVAAPSSPRPGRTTVNLEFSDGSRVETCETVDTYSRSERTQFLDLSDCIEGRSFTELSGMTAELRMQPERESTAGPGGVDLPDLAEARLRATFASVVDAPLITMSVDEAAGSFARVHGGTYLPDSTVDVTWAGTAGVQAVFNGDLQVSSLGSRGSGGVGVVCCGPEYPSLLLRAFTDLSSTEPRGLARVRLEEAPSGDVDVIVTDWQLCEADGCEVNVVSPVPP